MTAFLDWFDRHKVGIIGTLMLHTVMLFVLTMASIRTTVGDDLRNEMRLDVVSEEEAMEMLERIEAELSGVPMEAGPVQNLTSNITAELARPGFSQERLAERVEEELRNLEQAEFDRLAEERNERGENITIPELDPSKWNKELYMDKAAEPVRVEGQVTVWHDLKDRNREHDMPGYLCRLAGRVAINVQVDRNGTVRRAEFDPSRSANADDCMVEHALNSSGRALG